MWGGIKAQKWTKNHTYIVLYQVTEIKNVNFLQLMRYAHFKLIFKIWGANLTFVG